jgi:hypothetical protein
MTDLDYPTRWEEVRERVRRRHLIRLNNILITVVCILSVVGYIVIFKQ